MGPPSDFIRALPKAELHLHLEGAIDAAMLVELAALQGETLAEEEAARLYEYSDFTGFMMAFRAITKRLRTADDYEFITYRLMQRLVAENVKHAEVTVSVGACLLWERDFDEIFLGLERGRERGARDFGVSLYWIFDAVRHFGPEKAMEVAEYAVKYGDRESVVAFSIGGDERRAGPELFAEVYAFAAGHGLRLACHAGETVGPESIWNALRILKTERVGHGLTAAQDDKLLAHLADRQIPMEVAVTSNYRTGCIAAIAEHPLRRFVDEGLLVTLNTDDPALFGTTLCREYQIAQEVFGLSNAQLKKLAMDSFRASFLPEAKKRELLGQF